MADTTGGSMRYQEVLEEVLRALDTPIVKNNPATAHAIVHLEEILADMKQSGRPNRTASELNKYPKKTIGDRIKDILPNKNEVKDESKDSTSGVL